jgi:predicted nucleotidyltransferase
MHRHEKAALEHITAVLKERYPENILSVIAFGSKVRGDYSEDSDYDILIIVKDRSIPIMEGIIDVFVEEEMKTNISFDPVIKSADTMALEKKYNTPFFKNITNEGVPL